MSFKLKLKDKVILITGGTGSFGRTVSDYLLQNEFQYAEKGFIEDWKINFSEVIILPLETTVTK